MTQRQREHGVEALFRVLSSGGHSTITQLRTDGMKALPGLFSSYVGLDSEDRHYINQAINNHGRDAFHALTSTKRAPKHCHKLIFRPYEAHEH